MQYAIIKAINGLAEIIILMLFARAIMSWFVHGMNSSIYKIYEVLCNLTEPIVAPFRNFTIRLGGGYLDLSLILAFIVISMLRRLLIHLVIMFM